MMPSSVALSKNRSLSSRPDVNVSYSSDCSAVGFPGSLATATDRDGVWATRIGHNRRRSSGRTPAEPYPRDGAGGDSVKRAFRPAKNHPWRKGL
jgi:hypothetical protein